MIFMDKREINMLVAAVQRVADKEVIVRDGAPRTDGKVIYVPMRDRRFIFDDIIGFGAHEAAHIRFKSFKNESLTFSIMPARPDIAGAILNVFEDARVEMLLREVYPGFSRDLDAVNARILDQYQLVEMLRCPIKSHELIDYLLKLISVFTVDGRSERLYRLADENGRFVNASHKIGDFWRVVVKGYEIVKKGRSLTASVVASKMVCDAMLKFFGDIAKKENDASDTTKKENDGVVDGDMNDGDVIDVVEENLATGKLSDEKVTWIGECREDEFNGLRGDPSEIKRSFAAIDKKSDVNIDEILKESKEAMDKLINEIKENMKKDVVNVANEYTTVRDYADVDVEIIRDANNIINYNRIYDSLEVYYNVTNENREQITEIRRMLLKIAKSNSIQAGMRSGIVNSRDLSRVAASRGRYDRPFMSPVKSKGARILIIVDESGSMYSDNIRVARNACIVLADAMKGTAIEYAIIGFSAVIGRSKIVEKVYKAFDEPPRPEKIGAIYISTMSSENRDGTSIESAVKRHLSRYNDNNVPIVIVISDGAPAHGGTLYMGKRGMDHTAKVVHELSSKYKMYAVSVDETGDKYLRSIYGKDRFVVVKLGNLMEQMIYLIRTIAQSIS